MIIKLKPDFAQHASKIAEKYNAIILSDNGNTLLVTPSALKEIDTEFESYISDFWVFADDMQLSSRKFINETREIKIGNITIGGNTRNTLLTIGPCSVESREQIFETAELIKSQGLHTLRAGSFKPRTSPYSFQGMGKQGLALLQEVRAAYGFSVITEIRDASHADEVIEFSDVIQVGAKAMYDQGILRKCAKTTKPILLKRGFGSTIQEFVQAAEFILSGGNPNVILCERGIRTFETKTRFSLDLCGVAYLKEYVNLPVILDPSHAMGYAYGVPDLARACMAMDIDGLLIEVHPDPSVAKSDASQQLNHEQFIKLLDSLKPIANAVNRKIV